MIVISKPSRSSKDSASCQRFLAMVPAITAQACFSFRTVRPEAREELVQEVLANCLVAFDRLAKMDKLDLVYPGALARLAVAQVRLRPPRGQSPQHRRRHVRICAATARFCRGAARPAQPTPWQLARDRGRRSSRFARRDGCFPARFPGVARSADRAAAADRQATGYGRARRRCCPAISSDPRQN